MLRRVGRSMTPTLGPPTRLGSALFVFQAGTLHDGWLPARGLASGGRTWVFTGAGTLMHWQRCRTRGPPPSMVQVVALVALDPHSGPHPPYSVTAVAARHKHKSQHRATQPSCYTDFRGCCVRAGGASTHGLGPTDDTIPTSVSGYYRRNDLAAEATFNWHASRQHMDHTSSSSSS